MAVFSIKGIPCLYAYRYRDGHLRYFVKTQVNNQIFQFTLSVPKNTGHRKLKQLTEQKVAEFKANLKNGKSWTEWLEEYIVIHQLCPKTANAYRQVLQHYGFDHAKNMTTLVTTIQSGSNVTQKLRIVKAFFAWLIQNGLSVINPAANVRIPTIRARTRTLSLDEVHTFYNELNNATPECALFGHLLLETGARLSTIHQIKLGDMQNQMLQLENLKCKRPYSVQIPISQTTALLWQQVVQNKSFAPSDALFTSKCHVLARKLRDTLNKLFNQETSRERVVIHSLRHTAATLALEAGVAMDVVSQMLDHRSINTTYSFYAKNGQNTINQAFDKLFSILDGSAA